MTNPQQPNVLLNPTEEQILAQEVRRHILVTPWDKLLQMVNPV